MRRKKKGFPKESIFRRRGKEESRLKITKRLDKKINTLVKKNIEYTHKKNKKIPQPINSLNKPIGKIKIH